MPRKHHFNKAWLLAIPAAILCIILVIFICTRPKTTTTSGPGETDGETLAEIESEIETTTEARDPVTIDLMMIGDMLMHMTTVNSGKQADGTYNYDHLFKNIKTDIQAADISIVNQETILGGTELGLSAYPCFNSPYELGVAEVNAGFNVILHATNHTLDKGIKGVENCINFWKTKYPNVAALGMNSSQQEYENNVYVYDKDGFKVALLNYTYGTNGIKPPVGKEYCVNMLDKAKITSDVKKAKELADMVVVCPHWGTEYVYQPDASVKEWTQLFLDLGVDVVIGTHPHVIEPVETLTRADGHQMLVYYSLGNFVSNQNKMPRMLGAMAKVRLIKGSDGSCYINSYEMIPIVTHYQHGTGKMTSYKLADYTDTLASSNYIRSFSGCGGFNVKYCNDLSKQVLGEQYDTEKKTLFVQLRK
ncbi:MAG: CapA family protein [Lachnospira sp.]|nr:CapA family protein [Lachnospira sp.]